MSWKYWIIGLIVLFLIAQFFQPDRSVAEVPRSEDLLSVHSGEGMAVQLIESTCYDCHSNQTKYPWYAYITPVNFWLQDHIDHGREHLNFSTFSALPAPEKGEELAEAAEEVEEGHMPLNSYTWLHAKARFSKSEQRAVADWFSQAANDYPTHKGKNGREDH